MRTIFVLVSACLALAGCAVTQKDAPRLPYTKCNNPNQCTIEIINPTCESGTCTASVSIPALLLERGKPHNIIWTLPTGFEFCDTAGDGAWLTQPDRNAQFDSPRADNPSGSGPCKFKEFRLKAKNTKSLPHDPYEYKIYFHSDGGTRYVVDPYIMNQ